MPEAPEVQTVLSTLEDQIKDLRIEEVQIRYEKLIENESVSSFIEKISNQHFRQFHRYGKYLIFALDDYDWIVHLRMEGKFYLLTDLPKDKHIHAGFLLSDGRWLCYHDTRKFGRMKLYLKQEDFQSLPCFQKLGPDVLDPSLNSDYLYQAFHHSNRSLKACLLDQSLIAGIGNIYADEICFACQLDPRSRSKRISKKDCVHLVYHMQRIIRGAMRYGGTTIRSYTSSLGVTGRFQLKLRVHDRKDEECTVCHTLIKKIIVAQRGTYLCPKCQKRK